MDYYYKYFKKYIYFHNNEFSNKFKIYHRLIILND